MDIAQWCLARNEHQPSPLFKHHVCSPGDQVVTEARGNRSQRLHAAGYHDHSVSFERAAGYRGCHVVDVVNVVG